MMNHPVHLASGFWILCISVLILTHKNHASSIKIHPRQCTNAMGQEGTCMFVWQCIKQDGTQLGPCVDGFLVGTCCSLPREEDNFVPGSSDTSSSSTVQSVASTNLGVPTKIKPPIVVTTVTKSPTPVPWTTSMSSLESSIVTSRPLRPSQKPTVGSDSSTGSKPVKSISQIYADCGIPNPHPKMKVVGGTDASFGEWPWQVSVRRTSFFGFASTHRCGGALLNAQWVATAGHCVDDLLKSQIRVRVGEYDFSTTQEPFPFQERGVDRKVVHNLYNFFTYEYDLAVLKLDAPIVFQPHVKPICLPPTDGTLTGMNATVTGWGRLSEGGSLPSKLQHVQVPIISNEKCKQMFRNAGRHESIPDIFLCAGYENGGRDSCQGDSGGPLQVKGEDGRWFLAGIISWGIGCAEPNMPGVCTRISRFTDWIKKSVS